ncbi:unnamed protein product [Zymoseptoria tritici ST99CH_1A5]|uniref:Glycosyltransferase 2-like domain-containing protein n=2 Tax=Zymoseptoria tritici TaxID=1047171 RepID=A0A1Y6M036_ZYMTR|nr:unnamed protein product [Zymoseptoria tritici ST99CH_1A5]
MPQPSSATLIRQVFNVLTTIVLCSAVAGVFISFRFPGTWIRSGEILIAIYDRLFASRKKNDHDPEAVILEKQTSKDTVGCAVGWREEEDIFERCLEALKASDVCAVVVGVDGDTTEDMPMLGVFGDVFPDAPPPIHLDTPVGDALLDAESAIAANIDQLLSIVETQITTQLGIDRSQLCTIDAICIYQPHRNKKAILLTTFLAGIVMARAKQVPFLFSCDSDTVVAPQTIDQVVASLRPRPQAGGASGRISTWKSNQSFLCKLQSLKWWFDQDVSRTQTAATGFLECQPGPSCAFRATALEQVLITWYSASAWGRRCVTNEDRDLTAKLLHAGWEIYYVPHAVVWTDVPTSLAGWFKQQLRWSRGTHFQRLSSHGLYTTMNPYFTMYVMKDMLMPFVACAYLVWFVLTGERFLRLSEYDLAVSLLVELIYTLLTAADRIPWTDLVYLFPSYIFYSLTKPAIHIWSLFTMFNNSWGNPFDRGARPGLTMPEYAWCGGWVYLTLAASMKALSESMNYKKRNAINETFAVVVFPSLLALGAISAWHLALTRPKRRWTEQVGSVV